MYVLLFLGHKCTGRGALVLPVGRDLACGTVISGQSVDARFDENQSELAVLVLAVHFQMLADLHGLLDEHVQIFRDLRSESVCL